MTNDATQTEYLKQNGYFDLAHYYIHLGPENYNLFLEYLIEKYPDDENFFNNLNKAVWETATELYERRDAINTLLKAGTIKDATVFEEIMPQKDIDAAVDQMGSTRTLVSARVWEKNATPTQLFVNTLSYYWHLPNSNQDEASPRKTSSLQAEAHNLIQELDEADVDLIEKIKISESHIVCFNKWISDDVLSALQFKIKFDLMFEPDLSSEEYYRQELSDGLESLCMLTRKDGSIHMYQFLHDLLCKKHNEWVEKAFKYVKSKEKIAVGSSEVLNNFIAWMGQQREQRRGDAHGTEAPKVPELTRRVGIKVGQLALYYHYLQVTGYRDEFAAGTKSKMEEIEELVKSEEMIKLMGGPISAKHFQLKYNSYSHYKTNRIAVNNCPNIAAVIPLLMDYPRAYELAKDELKIAQVRPPKKS